MIAHLYGESVGIHRPHLGVFHSSPHVQLRMPKLLNIFCSFRDAASHLHLQRKCPVMIEVVPVAARQGQPTLN